MASVWGPLQSQIYPGGTHLLLRTRLNVQWEGWSEPSQRGLRPCGGRPCSLWAGRGRAEELLRRFPFREKSPRPAAQQCVCPAGGVIRQESGPSHPGLGMCFHLETGFLPCSGEHHFLGTDRDRRLSSAEYLINRSLDSLRERKCQS